LMWCDLVAWQHHARRVLINTNNVPAWLPSWPTT
jgi:hypothetical protein